MSSGAQLLLPFSHISHVTSVLNTEFLEYLGDLYLNTFPFFYSVPDAEVLLTQGNFLQPLDSSVRGRILFRPGPCLTFASQITMANPLLLEGFCLYYYFLK